MVNVELLEKTLQHIKANPETWSQGAWRCETGTCFAGWTGLLAGGKWSVPSDERNPYIVTPEGHVTHVSTYATRALGISEDDADILFMALNEIEDLESYVEELKTSGFLVDPDEDAS